MQVYMVQNIVQVRLTGTIQGKKETNGGKYTRKHIILKVHKLLHIEFKEIFLKLNKVVNRLAFFFPLAIVPMCKNRIWHTLLLL